MPDKHINTKKPHLFRDAVFVLLGELADKPGLVVDSYSSRPAITHRLKRPTRSQREQRHTGPYLVLLRVEFTLLRTITSRTVRSYRTLSPLPP
ncbi:MAG: hypothetical protein ACI90A_000133 [Shewanella sp.]|jgi:hypothetical protein